jgi:hypothetical protein
MAESQPEPLPIDGSRRFTPLVLLIYDWLVIRISDPLVWRCPTQLVLLPFFTDNFSKRHMDIGVGNGYFPTKAQAFGVAKQHLSDEGVLCGVTGLGKAWEKLDDVYRVNAGNKLAWPTSFALGFYSKRRIFDSYEEDNASICCKCRLLVFHIWVDRVERYGSLSNARCTRSSTCGFLAGESVRGLKT